MSPHPTPARRPVWRSPYLWAFVVGILTLTALRPLLRHEPEPPPILGRLPAFSLTASDGTRFGSDQLSGQVYVASFFFTRCVTICPVLIEAVSRLERRFAAAGVDEIRLVSITVDPNYDTPERLRAYAAERNLQLERWKLLTGPRDDIEQLVVDGFKTAMGSPVPEGAGYIDIVHTGKLVLVDGEGNIRGYFSTDTPGLDEVFHRSQHVLAEARRARDRRVG